VNKINELFKSPHVQIALATGTCIIIMAYVSKRVLPEPIGYLPLAIPPFFMTLYEYFSNRYKDKKITTTFYWVVAIFLSTALVILYYMI